jgi:hypothetical protein
MQEEQFSPPSSPRPFGELPGLWTKVLQMSEEFFTLEAPRASGSNTIISLIILAVITAILTAISSVILGGAQMAFLPEEYRETLGATMGSSLVGSLCTGLFGTVIGFYLGNGLIYLIARAFGGTGDFGTQAYLQSLFTVPLGIVGAVINLIPCVGCIAALALGIYQIVLSVRVIKVTHRLEQGKAVAVVLIPMVVLFLLVLCGVIFFTVVVGAAVGDIFQNISNNLQ